MSIEELLRRWCGEEGVRRSDELAAAAPPLPAPLKTKLTRLFSGNASTRKRGAA